jgi:LysM repeat protein
MDEEKESHYLAGKSRVSSLDYQGALECFEKALEVNPRSAPAHFEAGLLCERYKQDPAAAIYHFNRFLELKPDAGYAEVVKGHVMACKQELAKSVSLAPVAQSIQKEFELLSQENKALREEVEAWRAKMRSQTVTQSPTIAATAASAPSQSTPAQRASNVNSMPRTMAMLASGRTHTVKSGETPGAIAKKYGVRVDALLAANPRLDPRRLQVGQTLNLPPH